MKAPVSWLKRYVDIDATPAELRELLTNRGLEVEGIDELGSDIKNVVVGKILKIEKHPDADKLVVCQMDLGEAEPVQIVTGAHNISEGDLVPVAKHGSELPGGVKIKKGKLRGVESCGMLCSGAELNLSEEDYAGAGVYGILILHENYPTGMDIREVFSLNDVVLDAEPTPNRPDQLSIIGIAREIASATDKQLRIPEANVKGGQTSITDHVKVDVLDSDLCPRYMARTVKDIKIAPSPKWMQDCLKAAGMRAINNIVDITNFVMIETGQPMHAFDLACVGGEHIVVRRANAGEKTVTLDGKTHDLPENTLMIADPEKSVGIAGIMGGENSEIKEETKTILFESAVFKCASIRRSAKALGMMTEASQRFCKGIDIEGTAYALERACSLVEELGAGTVENGIIDVCGADIARKHILARPEKVNALVALEVSAEKMAEILNSLSMPTVVTQDGKLDIEIPHFRDDMEGEADVAEEIARVVGYDQIPLTLMRGDLVRGRISERQKFADTIKTAFAQAFFEIYTYSFTGPYVFDKLRLPENDPLRNCVRIKNPFGDDNSLMRSTGLTGMLPVIATNAKRKVIDLRFFEVTNVHTATEEGKIPVQRQVLTLGVWGQFENFYTLKGVIDRFLKVHGYEDVSYKAGGDEYYHPFRKAEIYVGGVLIGTVGEIHPETASAFDIPAQNRTITAELDIDTLFECARTECRFKTLPKFPAVDRDLAVIVKTSMTWGEIKEVVQKSAGKYLRSIEIFDVYKGEKLAPGCKSIAFTMSFRSDEKTLTDDEINEAIASILAGLESIGAKLRD